MNHLTDEQRSTLFKLLDAQEAMLESAIHEHVTRLRDCSTPGTTPPSGDIADQADVELIRQHENSAVVRDVRALRDIEAARARLANGSAGICIDCASAIGFERLLVQPTATRCPDCQGLYERTHQAAPELGMPDMPR